MYNYIFQDFCWAVYIISDVYSHLTIMMFKNNCVNESLIESIITMTSDIIYIYIILFIIVGSYIIFMDSKFLKIIFV